MSVRKARGFTIFEMMVVVAIAAVVSAFAIPAFRNVMANTRVNSVAEEFTNSVALARNTAIARRRTVVLMPAAADAASWTLRLDSKTGQVLSEHQVEEPVRLDYTPNVTVVTFNPNGYVQQTEPAVGPLDLSVTVCDASSRREFGRTITVTRVGRIRSVPNATLTTCNP